MGYWIVTEKKKKKKNEMVQKRAARWTMNDYSPYSSVTRVQQNLAWW